MNLKVGDKVRIKDNVEECEFGYTSSMLKYIGGIATIMKINYEDEIQLDVDGGVWYWSEDVLELIDKSKLKLTEEEFKQTVKGLSEEKKQIEDDIVDDSVNHPSHYTDGKIEVMDFIEDKQLNFARGNVIKYVSRAGKKDPNKELEDLNKAMWYLKREIERLEKEK